MKYSVENGDIKSPTFVEYENQDSRGLIMRADGYHFDEDDDDGKKVKDDQLNELTIIVSDFTYEAKGEDISKLIRLTRRNWRKSIIRLRGLLKRVVIQNFFWAWSRPVQTPSL